MEEVSLTDPEMRYYGDLFTCCDVEKTGKISMLKAMELYRSSNISDEVLNEIISIASVPAAALYISRVQFYSCLKLVAAHQSGMQLRQELIAATVQLPLPRFSWKESASSVEAIAALAAAASASNSFSSASYAQTNGVFNAIPPPPIADRKNSLTRRQDWQEVRPTSSRRNSSQQPSHDAAIHSDLPSTDSDVEQNESSCDAPDEDVDAKILSSGACGSGGGGSGANSSDREHRRRRGSPEAWSTNSDSPTPTNSVAERPWAKENLWQGLLGDEHRQLLGTEEESSDRHSSDDDDAESDLEAVYQITPEQRDYYYKQFKAVQHDINGLLSGPIARVFFEKSRIPVEELRHIWQLCDVTRDGALSLAEFTAAMHLVVLRRNNIPLPQVLPACLHPSVIYNTTSLTAGVGGGGAPPPKTAAPVLSLQQQQANVPIEPPEADLLHLNDDDDEDNTDNTIIGNTGISASGATTSVRTNNNNNNEKNVMNLSTISNSSQISAHSRQGINVTTTIASSTSPTKNGSISNSPKGSNDPGHTASPVNTTTNIKSIDRALWTTDVPPAQWTKFTESPTSNVSSPGPKPVNFDMQRTAQAVVSDPQILHPVPLRVTPVAGTLSNANSNSAGTADVVNNQQEYFEALVPLRSVSPKQSTLANNSSNGSNNSVNSNISQHRESFQQQQQANSDLRAIQRPQPKKLASKNIGGLPPPPQREPSIGSSSSMVGAGGGDAGGDPMSTSTSSYNAINTQMLASKRDAPPLPPPRPHRHLRSSSLDLNKFKLNEGGNGGQQAEITTQASFDLQTSTGFADFTQFSSADGNVIENANVDELTKQEQQHSVLTNANHNQTNVTASSDRKTTVMPPTRFTLQSNQRVSAFEVYRKPNNTRNNSQSPSTVVSGGGGGGGGGAAQMPLPFGAIGAAAISGSLPNADLYEKRVNAITEQLRHVSFKSDGNMSEVLRHLKEQNSLLLRLCNDLSDELLTVQSRKEELRQKLELFSSHEFGNATNVNASGGVAVSRTGSSISAPVTANITGNSGVHSNV